MTDTGSAGASRRLHPSTILFSALTIARHLLLPAAIGGISAARRDVGDIALWAGLIAGVPALIGALGTYLTFRYRIVEDALVIDSGVVTKQHRVIPLASVQNIDISQGALQRVFGVATVKVETATGGLRADAEFAVLSRAVADELRSGLMAGRAATLGKPVVEETALEYSGVSPDSLLVRLSPRDLVVAGATANHAGIIVAALAGSFQLLDDLPFLGSVSALADRLSLVSLDRALVLGLGAIAILLLAGWIFSIVGSLVRHYDFTLTCRDEQLHKTHGLWSRRSRLVPLKRVQALRVEESVLRRPLQLAAMKVVTAGTAAMPHETGGAETIVPVTPAHNCPRLVGAILPRLDYEEVSLNPVDPLSRRRSFMIYGLFLFTLAAGIALWRPRMAWVPGLLLPAAWLLAAWQYRHRGYARVPGYAVARNGVFNQITWIVPERKVQTLHLKESPFQRRHGLASVVLDVAGTGGHAAVRDLRHADALRLLDSLPR